MTVQEQQPNASPGDALVVLDGVNKWFADLHVLKEFDVTVKRGEVVVAPIDKFLR